MKYKSLEILSEEELIFGRSADPVKCGFDLEIGGGEVIPETNYMPKVDG